MTRMLDIELKDLMIKTFKNIVDCTADETERCFLKTLRNKTAPDLRNVLGLNITKRLLNVYNPLHVEVKFNGKPQKEELREFLKKYKFIAFARKAVNIFAAQVRDIDDFDKLCKEREMKCGSVSVTVCPAYKFTVCPKNLKTKYKENYCEEITEIINDEGPDECESKKVKVQNSVIQANNTNAKAKLVTVKIENIKEERIEDESPNKSLQTIQTKETGTTPTTPAVRKTENKDLTPPATKITTPLKETRVAVPTKVAPVKTVTKVTPSKVATQVAPSKTATQVASSKTATQVVASKTTNANKAQTKTIAKTTPDKIGSKVTPKKGTQQKFAKTKTAKDEDDYDELDDHDILALMSEGIVLDECSASDGE